jgi:hypothetical protein
MVIKNQTVATMIGAEASSCSSKPEAMGGPDPLLDWKN